MSNTNFQSNGTDFFAMYDITTGFVDSTQATAICGYKVGNTKVDLANMFSLKTKISLNGNYTYTDASSCSFTYGVSNKNVSSLFVEKGSIKPKIYTYVRSVVITNTIAADYEFQLAGLTHISFAIFGAGGGGGTGGWGSNRGNGKGGGGGGAGALIVVDKLPVFYSNSAIVKVGVLGVGGTHEAGNVPATYDGVNGKAPLGNGKSGGNSILGVLAYSENVGQEINQYYSFEAGGGQGGTAGISSDQDSTKYSNSGKGGTGGIVDIFISNPRTSINSNDAVNQFIKNTYGGVDISGFNSIGSSDATEGGNGGTRQNFTNVFSTFYNDFIANFPNEYTDRIGKYGSATNTDFYINDQNKSREVTLPGTTDKETGHGYGIGGGGGGGRTNVNDRGDYGANGSFGAVFIIGYKYE